MAAIRSILRALIYNCVPNTLFIQRVKREPSTIYLTFDDGPHPDFTPRLLDTLNRFKAKATFFLVGANIVQYPEVASEIINRGHVIGNHTLNHHHFSTLTLNDQLFEIMETQRLIQERLNYPCRFFRAPQGRFTISLVINLWMRNIVPVHWSRDSLDYQNKSCNELTREFLENPINPGDVILFHDDHGLSLEMIDELMPYWKAKNYDFKGLARQ